MRRHLTYFLVVFTLLLAACREKKQINWNVSLDSGDQNPYGCYLAFESLKHFFPGVKTDVLSGGFKYNNIDNKMIYSRDRALLILDGLRFNISEEELNKLITFASAGNEIVLFCSELDTKLGDKLGCYKQSAAFLGFSEENPIRSRKEAGQNIDVLALARDSSVKYGYRGRMIWAPLELNKEETSGPGPETDTVAEDIYGSIISGSKDSAGSTAGDSSIVIVEAGEAEKEDATGQTGEDEEASEYEIDKIPDILGYSESAPNFVRYAVGEGHISIHAAPLTTSNYFLLQENNINYLAGIWNTLPTDIGAIYWNSYLNRRAEHSDLGILWRNPATRWALWLAIIALCLYVLLELKRRQEPIPIVKPLENSSVNFVETVGRLYYNKGNHRNLAEKMVQHFLEHVRLHYYLSTNHINDAFAQALANKSGMPIEVAANLVEMINEVRMGQHSIDEAYLYHLNNTIQRFYKKPTNG